MIKRFFLFLTILLIGLCSRNTTINAQKVADRNNNRLLEQLDHLIENKEQLHEQKEQHLSTLKRQLRMTYIPTARFALQDSLFHAYLHYQADSALIYLQQKELTVKELDDESLKDDVIINRAEALGVMGMYDDALRMLKTLVADSLNESNRSYYFRTCRACYGWLADYTTDSAIKKMYQLKTQAYRDSILTIIPDGVERECVWAEKQYFEGNTNGVLPRLIKLYDASKQKGSIEYIYLCYTIAELYEMNDDLEHEIYYLTLTAIADMTASIREYASLPKLAQKMYEKGEITRAYKYLTCSLEDAVGCNARLRSIEVTQIYPIIEKKYKTEEERDKKHMRTVIIVMSILSILLLVAVFYLYRWMKKLSRMRGDLAQANTNLATANAQLANANEELAQTGRIKEAYIARYLGQCVMYLDKLEAYRRSLAKLAMASRIEELYKSIKSEDFIAHERKEFYSEFDKSFLSLFPHFVESFNELLQEDSRIQPKSKEMLTTELRIFALIRLGITDSNRIAHFLRYSLTTIYNYRSKLRNKAYDKENFEQNILNL